MKQYLTKSFLAASLLLLSPIGDAIACGPMLFDDQTRFSIFRKETMDNPSMDPFHYSHDRYATFNQTAYASERSINIEEWWKYGKQTFSKKSIGIMQYEVSAEDFLNAYNTNDYSAFEGNDFLEFLLMKENKDALLYFAFAKQVESAQFRNNAWEDNWNQVQKTTRQDAMQVLMATALTHYKNKKTSAFLKDRYAFQYMKCAYYHYYYNENAPDVSTAVEVFDQHLSRSQSIVGQWALIYYADMQKDPLMRTRYFLQAFDKSGDKRMRASQFIATDDLNALAAVEKNPYYLQMIDIFKAIKSRGRNLENIKKLYQQDKFNKFLPLLMTREINKLEDWIWSNRMLQFSPSYYSNDYYNSRQRDYETFDYENYVDTAYEYYAERNLISDIAYLQEVQHFFQSMDFGKNEIATNFNDLAVVHLYNVNGQYKEAEQKLKSMSTSQTDAATLQYNYEKLIVLANNNDLNDPRTRDIMAMTIQYQEEHQPRTDRLKSSSINGYVIGDDEDDAERYSYVLQENLDPSILVYLGRKYIAIGQGAMGALLLHKSRLQTNEYAYNYYGSDTMGYAGISYLEKYAKPSEIDMVLALKHKEHKTKFEKVLSPDVWAGDLIYKDLKGTLLFRQGDYAAAAEVFQSMPADFWEQHQSFKEYLPTHSLTDLGTYLPKSVKTKPALPYAMKSKRLITQEMIQLQSELQTAKTTAEKATAQLNYANALFNISYYGNAWMAYAYGKSSTELSKKPYYSGDYAWAYYSISPSESNKVEDYYGVENAIEAYQQVIALHPSPEVAATATLMLALCDKFHENYLYNLSTPYIAQYGKTKKQYKSPFYQEFKNKYSKTSIYKLAKTHCPDVF